MHDHARRANLVFTDAAVNFGEMTHGLKQSLNELLGHTRHFVALLFEYAKTRLKAAIKLMTQNKTGHGSPWIAHSQANQGANDFAPIQP